MKKVLPLLIIFLSVKSQIYSQSGQIVSKPITEIFSDFHMNLSSDTTTGFGVKRAYLGYNYVYNQNWSGKAIVNIGTPDDLPEGSEPRRYAYFKEASFSYTKDKLNVTFGITTTRLFTSQQRFWGKRYLADPIETSGDYGYNSDLGVVADYKFSETVTADLAVMNGEGYNQIQLDNNLRSSAGITITPGKKLVFRLYSDIMKTDNIWQSTFIGFTGFRNDLFNVGVEYIYQTNHDFNSGHDAWGLSGTGAITVLKNTELFLRYDYATSFLLNGEQHRWNYSNDGSFMISGIQYTFNSSLRMSLNYRSTFPSDPANKKYEAIYLNTRFYF
jgi:hypothetical protein